MKSKSLKRLFLSVSITACLAQITIPAYAASGPYSGEKNSTGPAHAQKAYTGQRDHDGELEKFFAEYNALELGLSPLTKSYRGIIDGDYGRWDNYTETGLNAITNLQRITLWAMQERFPIEKLSPDNQLSHRLFTYATKRNIDNHKYKKNHYIFDQMNGLQSFIPAFLINIHRVRNEADANAYISRLNNTKSTMDVIIPQVQDQVERGVIVPDWVFPYVISDSKNIITGAPFDNGADSPFYADIKAKIANLSIEQSRKDALIERARIALLESVGPAYNQIIAEMERQQALGPQDDGVWRFPDGTEYYAERLRYYTTTNLTPDEIHQIGLDNVARIHGEMRDIMKKVRFKGNLQEFFKYARTDDRFYYKDRESYLADAHRVIDAMEAKLPEFFNTFPMAALTIKPVEAFREKSAGKAFYQRPTADGSRPGVYYVNLYNLRDMSKNEMEALAYHEGLPGHHMQLAIQTELKNIPSFRQFGRITAYSEGWGLYTEELGKDMGFYTDYYSDFGRLGMELWRACRLVVDTGIHHKRWSREQAIQYLTDNTPNPAGDIRKAIERYIVYPGQATAYMIGKLKIMELRARAIEMLGDKFTMGDFHDVILKPGPVPLAIMEENVNKWIEDGGGRL